MVLDSLRKLLGVEDLPSDDQQPLAGPREEEATNLDSEGLDAAFERRDAFWGTVGDLESDVLTHLISPSFLGGPAWPAPWQAYRVIRRNGGIIIASDGLSDPFDNVQGGGNGFEMEVFLETADIAPEHAREPGHITEIRNSWAFELVMHVANTVANAGGLRSQLERDKVLSIELPLGQSHALSKQLPPGYATEDDALGVVIGAPSPDFPALISDMPLSPVAIVPIMLVRADELQMLRVGGAEARRELAERLAASPLGHRIDLKRPSFA